MKPTTRTALAGVVIASLGFATPTALAQRGGGGRPRGNLRGGGLYVPDSGSGSFSRPPAVAPTRVAPPAPVVVQVPVPVPVPVQAPAGQPPAANPAPANPAPPAPTTGPGGGAPAWVGRPGWTNHQSWIHGYWHARDNDGPASWSGRAEGGRAGWGLNTAIFNWGYRTFLNPYAELANQPVELQRPREMKLPAPYDYSKPLRADAPAADVVRQAMLTFNAARAGFKSGHYASALEKTDEAIRAMPNDAALHEFRALCLFALGRYDRAAGALHVVLSAGPGWDWTTMAGLYPDIDAYTEHLRALEDYCSAHPDSAPAHFALAYQYMTEGFEESAARVFDRVVGLQKDDALARRIAVGLTVAADRPAQPPPAESAPAPAPVVDDSSLIGRWKAAPDASTAIELTLQDDGGFVWNVVRGGRRDRSPGLTLTAGAS